MKLFDEESTEICLTFSFLFYFGQLQQLLFCELLLLFLFYGVKFHEYLSDRKCFGNSTDNMKQTLYKLHSFLNFHSFLYN